MCCAGAEGFYKEIFPTVFMGNVSLGLIIFYKEKSGSFWFFVFLFIFSQSLMLAFAVPGTHTSWLGGSESWLWVFVGRDGRNHYLLCALEKEQLDSEQVLCFSFLYMLSIRLGFVQSDSHLALPRFRHLLVTSAILSLFHYFSHFPSSKNSFEIHVGLFVFYEWRSIISWLYLAELGENKNLIVCD